MRSLTSEEITILEKNGCTAEQWSQISVHENFDPQSCQQVTFMGKCYVGDLSGGRVNEYGFMMPNGIRHALIHDCYVDDGVRIDHVHDCISGYKIGKNCTIKNVNAIVMKGESSFGNGVAVSVMKETGGMEVILSDLLTAQVAYLQTIMGHDRELKESIHNIYLAYAESVKSAIGTIGDNVTIKNTGTIINAKIGEAATIESATYLENCSINSTPEHKVFIGYNVLGKDFIACSGSSITGGSTLQRCFVGQSTRMDHLFSAHDSLFFANCQCENGEACAVFAGPYTVTMHKSSMLIAGHFSFLNAGSGSNQSNHLYKLGPIHQGVVERGSKTTSDSYILWPSKVGPFSLIMGRHVHHVDTSNFPFSYVIENNDETYVVPGANLRSIGTIRDAKKWPQRDKRPVKGRLDSINFNLLSPFTIGKMETGYHKLIQLREFIGQHGKTYIYNNMHIRTSSLNHGLESYAMGIVKFIGNSVIQRLQGVKLKTENDLRKRLRPDHDTGRGEWLDLSGMIVPCSQVNKLLDHIKGGQLSTPVEINKAFRKVHLDYYDLEWDWSYDLLFRWYGLESEEELTIAFIKRVVKEWMEAVLTLDKYLYLDARKEYDIIGRVNFGLKIDPMQSEDSPILRDKFESNSFVLEVLEHMERKEKLGKETLAMLEGLIL